MRMLKDSSPAASLVQLAPTRKETMKVCLKKVCLKKIAQHYITATVLDALVSILFAKSVFVIRNAAFSVLARKNAKT